MLNKKKERELAYVVKIDNILPIEGAERVEQAVVGGWHIMVRKNQFKIGDYAIYFEIDSKVPQREPYMFLADKHFKIKTQSRAVTNAVIITPTVDNNTAFKATGFAVLNLVLKPP